MDSQSASNVRLGPDAIETQLAEIENDVRLSVQAAQSLKELGEVRVRFLGKKGAITAVLRGLGSAPPEERPRLGAIINDLKSKTEGLISRREAELERLELETRLQAERVDVTLPGRRTFAGTRHPLTLVDDEVRTIFAGLGYEVAEGPEVELDYYNFEALNLPKGHPAREMHDSLYITDEILLRTHTSPVQVRVMQARAPRVPIRIIAPGRVYRRDALDATHSPIFHQIEGLAVDEGITFGDLKGTLTEFVRRLFGKERKLRFRPSFFPFTEPSAEVDMSCLICNGTGGSCRVCKGAGWIEILGAGSVHPRVLRMSGYDPEKVSGFAFGIGLERIALLKYGIDDIRLFLENDVRFLSQFRP